jgi:predicted RNase H-like HicB family nuclease
MKDHVINIFYSEENEGYVADIPDLQYCSAVGDTELEALQELLLARTAWFEVAGTEAKSISPVSLASSKVISPVIFLPFAQIIKDKPF